MQHLTVESKDLLVGDEVAEVLTEYAAHVADQGIGDRVRLNAISSDGDEVIATIVLSTGTTLLTETSHNSLPEPDNAEVIDYMRRRIALITNPPHARQPQSNDEAAWDAQLGDI